MQIKTTKTNKINFKDVSANQVMALHGLLMHVQLGVGEASDALFDMLEALESFIENDGVGGEGTVSVLAIHSEKEHKIMTYPMIRVTFED